MIRAHRSTRVAIKKNHGSLELFGHGDSPKFAYLGVVSRPQGSLEGRKDPKDCQLWFLYSWSEC